MSETEEKAFWINAYNAWILREALAKREALFLRIEPELKKQHPEWPDRAIRKEMYAEARRERRR
jgi:hypothetical protein